MTNSFEHLMIFNHILAGMSENWNISTTTRRIYALQVFRKQYSSLLPDLYDEIRRLWPHWTNGRIQDEEKCFEKLCTIFRRLEMNCKPESLDAWKPFVTRSKNAVADTDKTIRRFLDSNPGKDQNRSIKKISRRGSCRIHPEKRIQALGVCCSCYSRILLLRKRNIITDDTPRELLDAILSLRVKKGIGSNLISDAQDLVRRADAKECEVQKPSSPRAYKPAISDTAIRCSESLDLLGRVYRHKFIGGRSL